MSVDLFLQLVKCYVLINQIVLFFFYDVKSIFYVSNYYGLIVIDFYGCQVFKFDYGGVNLFDFIFLFWELWGVFLDFYDCIVNWDFLICKVMVIVNYLVDEEEVVKQVCIEQLNLFEDFY